MQSSNLNFYYWGEKISRFEKNHKPQTVDLRVKRENMSMKQMCAMLLRPNLNLNSCNFFQGAVVMLFFCLQ